MSWEFTVLHWFESLHNPVTDAVMKAVTMLGNAGIFWILLTVSLLFIKKYRKCGIAMACSLTLSFIFTNILLKNLVLRPRPFWVDPTFNLIVKAPADFSFPSGHSSASFAAATACFAQKKKPGIILLILASAIAFSRLYLTVHYPTDVLAGLILGLIYGVVGSLITNCIYKKINTNQK
ncbi:MAG: phosphatase PAP2 family protein [Bacteroides sp.]